MLKARVPNKNSLYARTIHERWDPFLCWLSAFTSVLVGRRIREYSHLLCSCTHCETRFSCCFFTIYDSYLLAHEPHWVFVCTKRDSRYEIAKMRNKKIERSHKRLYCIHRLYRRACCPRKMERLTHFILTIFRNKKATDALSVARSFTGSSEKHLQTNLP